MSTDGLLHSSMYWHERAEEARARAEGMHDSQARLTMLNIAVMYERMADRAANREGAAK